MYKTDNENYNGMDSGCHGASEYLRRQSACEFCPFPKNCIQDTHRNGKVIRKDQQIYKKIKSGMSVANVARMFHCSSNSIYEAIRRARRDIKELGI